jgi:diacylglycerol kinase family enzyme
MCNSPMNAAAAPSPPPRPAPLVQAPPLALVFNGHAGHEDLRECVAGLREALQAAGRANEFMFASQPGELAATAGRALDWARRHGGAVVAVGGDGTVNAVAQVVLPAGCALGVVPQGTFNFFSRAHGIANDPAEALQQLLHAQARPVQAGLLNEHIFLVNASLGLYPRLLEDREAFKQRFGRYRLTAMMAGVFTIVWQHRVWTVELELADRSVEARTVTLFVGNNRLQLEKIGIAESADVEQGCLAAVMVKPVGRMAMLGLALRGMLGHLGEADQVVDFAFRRLTVRPGRGRGPSRIKVAVDGEVMSMAAPLRFGISPTPLQLLAPLQAASA